MKARIFRTDNSNYAALLAGHGEIPLNFVRYNPRHKGRWVPSMLYLSQHLVAWLNEAAQKKMLGGTIDEWCDPNEYIEIEGAVVQ